MLCVICDPHCAFGFLYIQLHVCAEIFMLSPHFIHFCSLYWPGCLYSDSLRLAFYIQYRRRGLCCTSMCVKWQETGAHQHAHTYTHRSESRESTTRGQFLIITSLFILQRSGLHINSIAKFLLLDSRENSQTVLIPVAGKRDGLFPEQSITSEYKNKYEELAALNPEEKREKTCLEVWRRLYVFPVFRRRTFLSV